MSLSAPEDAFLDVNDAHLRVYGNVHADGLKLGQLEIVTTTSTGSTIQFLHQHTAFTTTSNIEVGTTNHDLFVDTENSKVGILTNTPTTALDVNGTVKATAFDGDGALLTGIPSSAINGTLSQWTTVTGPKIHYSDGNVGIGIADPLHTLDVVGDINFTGTLREDGNPFVSTPWTIESGPTALSYTLGNVGVGGTTPSAKLEVTGNAHVSTDLSVGGNLTINTISAAATHGLGAVTALSNTSADTVLLTNTGTSLVASGAVQAVSFTDGTKTLTGGAWSGSAATLSTPRTIGGVSFDGSAAIVPTTFGAATFSGDVTVDSTTFHVDTANHRVGIGKTDPAHPLDIKVTSQVSGLRLRYNDDGAYMIISPDVSVNGYNNISESGDMGIFFSTDATTASNETKGFIIAPHVQAGTTSGLKILENGNVGIGLTPNSLLDVNGSTRSGYNLNTTSYFGRSAIGYAGHNDWASFAHIDANSINDYALVQNSSGRTILNCAIGEKISFSTGDTAEMTMTDGKLGIGTTAPVVRLHVYHGTSTARIMIQRASNTGESNLTLAGYHSSGSTEWQIYHAGSNANLRFWRGGDKGYIAYNASNLPLNFTGQHRTFIKDTPFTQAATLEGLIVSSNQNKYIRMSGGIEAGSNAVTINEALPVVAVSSTPRDKKCFGVISLSEDPETREETYGNFTSIMEKEDGDTRIYINSVGEGGIWVSNVDGPLEAGDYITTSALPGYGTKQDDDLLHNYTVAKITMDCDFNPLDNPIQKIKKKQGTKRYWRSSSGEETTQEKEGFDELIEREELVNDLDEHGQIQWEDHATETEKAYKIRYLDADGVETDEASAVHKAAFVGCTYHCG
jgi:hypothetical protein